MARDFTTASAQLLQFGVASIGTAAGACSGFSAHAWYNEDTAPAGDRHRIFHINIDTQNNLLLLNINASNQFELIGRSQAADAQQAVTTTSPGTGSWNSFGGALDFPGDSMTVYKNGVGTSAAVTFGSNTLSMGTPTIEDAIGGRNGSAFGYFDGKIAECAAWNVVLTDDEFQSLADGLSAICVRPSSLIFYAPLLGYSSEIDYVLGRTATHTNSPPKAEHPRIYMAGE